MHFDNVKTKLEARCIFFRFVFEISSSSSLLFNRLSFLPSFLPSFLALDPLQTRSELLVDCSPSQKRKRNAKLASYDDTMDAEKRSLILSRLDVDKEGLTKKESWPSV